MHQDDFRVVGHFAQGGGNGLLPRIAALDHAHGLLEFFPSDALFEALHFIASRGDDEVGHQRAGCDAPHAENHDGRAVQLEKLLGRIRAHARSQAGSRQNGGDSTHIGSGIRLRAPQADAQEFEFTSSGGKGRIAEGLVAQARRMTSLIGQTACSLKRGNHSSKIRALPSSVGTSAIAQSALETRHASRSVRRRRESRRLLPMGRLRLQSAAIGARFQSNLSVARQP